MISRFKAAINKNQMLDFTVRGGILYLIAFIILENRDTDIYLISTALDNAIPYCKYFIIPYMFWFVYMGFAFWYFLFRCNNQSEQKKAVYSFFTGMVVFVIVSLLFPNGHNLRPTDTGNGFFGFCVSLLYKADTSTNILPSLHVFETVAASVALLRQKELRKHRWFAPAVLIITVLITASTMFLKQHSIVDVISALLLNIMCYIKFYTPVQIKEEKCTRKKYLQSRIY